MHLGGVQHPVFGLAPLQGANHSSILSGGLRFASTTGYYLAALQAAFPEAQPHCAAAEPLNVSMLVS